VARTPPVLRRAGRRARASPSPEEATLGTGHWSDWPGRREPAYLLTMPLLTADSLGKSYGLRTLFTGASFSVEEAETLGVERPTGTGTSPLFRIPAGLDAPASGELAVRRGAAFGYLAQDPQFNEGATIFSAVASGRPELMDALAE